MQKHLTIKKSSTWKFLVSQCWKRATVIMISHTQWWKFCSTVLVAVALVQSNDCNPSYIQRAKLAKTKYLSALKWISTWNTPNVWKRKRKAAVIEYQSTQAFAHTSSMLSVVHQNNRTKIDFQSRYESNILASKPKWICQSNLIKMNGFVLLVEQNKQITVRNEERVSSDFIFIFTQNEVNYSLNCLFLIELSDRAAISCTVNNFNRFNR